MIKQFYLILFYFVFALSIKSNAQISGCTDPQSNNYNPLATVNDGSCSYNATNLTLTEKTTLSTPLLDESSGLEFVDGKLWTFNDSGNPNDIYRVDTATNTVFQTVHISNATNVDWEDMTSNTNYLFVGDFGNNNGNRQDLKIYRINKIDLTPTATSVTAAIINFSYSDQTSFPSLPNNNNFDCESMIFMNDSIHLFSKNWVDKQTRHYVLANSPGTQIAQYRETYNIGFLVTSASVQNFGVIALAGYDKTGTRPVALCMLYDHKNNLLFNGNKRKFDLSTELINGQVEGVEFFNSGYGYISNERFTSGAIVPPKLKSFDLSPYLPASFLYLKPDANFMENKTSLCKNASITFSDQSINFPTSWQWTFTGGTPSSSTLQNPQVQYSSVGIYSVTLIVGNGAGYDTIVKSNYITVNGLPSASISAGGSLNFCSGGSVLFSANIGTGLSYQWKKGTTNISTAINSTYSATSTGNYKVIVTNQSGCSKVSNTLSVTGPPAVAITATGSLDICPGDSVKFEVAFGLGSIYEWKRNNITIPGAASHIYSASMAGVYKVIVTNSFGCSKVSGKKTVTANCKLENIAMQSNGLVNIYPNPSSDYFNVQLNKNDSYEIIIYDLTGKKIQNHSIINSENIMLGENLIPGFYLFEIITGNKKELVKVVKGNQ